MGYIKALKDSEIEFRRFKDWLHKKEVAQAVLLKAIDKLAWFTFNNRDKLGEHKDEYMTIINEIKLSAGKVLDCDIHCIIQHTKVDWELKKENKKRFGSII